MNSSAKVRLLTALAFISCAVSLTSAQSATASRSYRMGTVGSLEMSVPSTWQDNFKTLDKPQGVTLAYRLPSRTDFYMKVTAVWIPAEKRSPVEPDWLRHAVERSARDIAGSGTAGFLLRNKWPSNPRLNRNYRLRGAIGRETFVVENSLTVWRALK